MKPRESMNRVYSNLVPKACSEGSLTLSWFSVTLQCVTYNALDCVSCRDRHRSLLLPKKRSMPRVWCHRLLRCFPSHICVCYAVAEEVNFEPTSKQLSRERTLLPVPMLECGLVERLGAVTTMCMLDEDTVCKPTAAVKEVFIVDSKVSCISIYQSDITVHVTPQNK